MRFTECACHTDMVSGTAVTPALISDAVTLTSMSTTGTSPPTSNMNMTPLYSRVRGRCAASQVWWGERDNISVCSNYRRMMKSRKTRSIHAGNATNRPVFAATSTLEQQRWCTSQTCRVCTLLRTSSSSAKKVSSSAKEARKRASSLLSNGCRRWVWLWPWSGSHTTLRRCPIPSRGTRLRTPSSIPRFVSGLLTSQRQQTEQQQHKRRRHDH